MMLLLKTKAKLATLFFLSSSAGMIVFMARALHI
jgi:hypothetical protein